MNKTVQQLNEATDPTLIRLAGMVRRFVVKLTSGSRWQLAGVRMPDGQEVKRAEVFGGVGFHARPPGEAECVVVNAGAATTPLIVAIRDEKTRAAVAGALGVDESMMFNTKAVMFIKADGTLEARSVGGVAVELATKADLQAVVDYVNKQFHHALGHIHATPSGPTTGITEGAGGSGTSGSAPSPTGTTKFKAE